MQGENEEVLETPILDRKFLQRLVSLSLCIKKLLTVEED